MEKSELTEVLSHFSVESDSFSFSRLTQGYINEAYSVAVDERPKYLLQQVNAKVFSNIEGIMANLQKALHYLSGEDYERIELIPTRKGKPYLDLGQDRYWRLMTYVEDSIAYDYTSVPEIAFEAGRIIGKFHELLFEAKTEDFNKIIPRFHELSFRTSEFNRALNETSDLRRQTAEHVIGHSEKILQHLKKLQPKELPLRVCHNDTKLNNLLFSRTSKKALCLIDLDTLMPGYLYYDFGDAIRTVVSSAPEDEKDFQKIRFEKPLFKAFVQGLMLHKNTFVRSEVKSLAFGAVFMPFLHGLRALTDYLQGDKYYRVSYPEQNLDRSRSLFTFSRKALENYDYMMETVLGEWDRS